MKSKKVVFINPGQFGYKAGYLYYCKYLFEAGWEVNFICYDQGFPKVDLPGLKIKYIPFKGNKVARTITWFQNINRALRDRDNEHAIFFFNHFKFSFIFGAIYSNKKINLDIRTGSIRKKKLSNYLENFQIRITTYFFNKVTILSEGLIDHLKLQREKCHLLPLGSEVFMNQPKKFDDIRMLYVGSLNNRQIADTIEGLSIFHKKGNTTQVTYDIFGPGRPEEIKALNDAIVRNNLDSVVRYHGRKNHSELQPYFDSCNVGISYVPKTVYFQYQPPTKTFEYILSGMVCIGTSTYENNKLINKNNGILCEDNSESFARALTTFVKMHQSYHSDKIVHTLEANTWSNIVSTNLDPYLSKLKNGL